MKTAMQMVLEKIEFIFHSEVMAEKEWWYGFKKEFIDEEKEQQLDLIRFVRLNDKMGKSVEDLYNEFYNPNK